MTTVPWLPNSTFPSNKFGRQFDVRLGKMLQSTPTTDMDVLTPYLKASSVTARREPVPTDEMWASPEDLVRYRVQEGDLLVTEGGDVGRNAFYGNPTRAIFQNSLHRVRSTQTGDIRYARYLLEALRGSDYLDVLCSVATIRHLTLDKLVELDVLAPALDDQLRIADFLDMQVDRIEKVIAARNVQRDLFAERSTRLVQDILAESGCGVEAGTGIVAYRQRLPEGWRVAELGHVLRQLTNGYVGPTRDLLVDDGIRYIQSLHIKNGRIDFARRPYFVPRDWHVARPRIHLRPEDVLIVQTGDIGQIAVVPDEIGEASCHALLIARAEPGIITGSFLGEYLRSPLGQQELLSRATGALHPHLESGIKAAPVVVPPLGVQQRVVKEVRACRRELERLDRALAESVEKLAELKRSLITAAVAGELDVTSADGSQVPA